MFPNLERPLGPANIYGKTQSSLHLPLWAPLICLTTQETPRKCLDHTGVDLRCQLPGLGIWGGRADLRSMAVGMGGGLHQAIGLDIQRPLPATQIGSQRIL